MAVSRLGGYKITTLRFKTMYVCYCLKITIYLIRMMKYRRFRSLKHVQTIDYKPIYKFGLLLETGLLLLLTINFNSRL